MSDKKLENSMAKASFPAGLGIPMLGARESEREYQNIPVAVNRKMAKTKNSLSKCLFKGSSRDDLPSSDNSRVLPSQEKGRDAVEYRLLSFSVLEDWR